MEKEIKKLLFSEELEPSNVHAICSRLFDPEGDLSWKVSFLREFQRREETPIKIALFAEEILKGGRSLPSISFPILEVCGTGGDRLGLFNVSTTVMFIVAACGAKVVKIGNRAATSLSGAADVLEALGINLFLSPTKVPAVVEAIGCVFLFAPLYYPALQSVARARSILAEEGLPTIFNFLGPLLNPARPSHQLLGVCKAGLIQDYADVLKSLGRKSAWVVCGKTEDAAGNETGMDEVSTLGETGVCSLREGKKQVFKLHPQDFGVYKARREDLLGGNAKESAHILVNILDGTDCGPRRDIALANAAAALCVCEIASNLSSGMGLASEAIASGEALQRLHALRSYNCK